MPQEYSGKAANAADVDSALLATLPLPVETLRGVLGLAAQRNILLRAAAAADVVLFLDDDFFIDHHYVATMIDFFRNSLRRPF